MEPTREPHATLVDLLDRILDKGLVIHADIIISVAGIPLIGVNLRAALAGMETMFEYGVMQAWDERTRAWERAHRRKKEVSLAQGEEIILKMFGSHFYSKGIYTTWRSGFFYLTDRRLFCGDFDEIILQTALEEIRGIGIKEMDRPVARGKREELFLLLENGKIVRLHAQDVNQLREAIEKRLTEMGLVWEENPVLPAREVRPQELFLTDGEEVVCRGKMWYLMPASSRRGWMSDTWMPGTLYLTNRRVYWQHSLEEGTTFATPINAIIAAVTEVEGPNVLLSKKGVLDVICGTDGVRTLASFSGEEIEAWKSILDGIIAKRGGTPADRERETCPQCGDAASVQELLENGCAQCGWVSPRFKKQLAYVAVGKPFG
ncbi:MAG: gas vesicle protein [Candidatus Binatia bacterium]